ncbi:MAG: HD domain-containing phosphohydrolase [Candidatus Omnitrophota bacterium]
MKNKSEYLKFLLLGLCVASIIYFFPAVIPQKISSGIGDLSSWYVYSLSRRSAAQLKIVGIEIDDYSLNKSTSRWPWRRSIYASLIKVLDREGARSIGIDFVFSGESESRDDDAALKSTLNNASCSVTLAYLFDYKKGRPLLPFGQDKDVKYYAGMVNTPQDGDSRVRRLRSYIALGGDTYYSFSVMLASSFLQRNPADVTAAMPLADDRTFIINYLLKESDIRRVSFYDVLDNLDALKQKYGGDFLRDSLVLVYPASAIFHDRYLTPIGEMSGGLLHLNGAADIIAGRFTRRIAFPGPAFLIFSLLAISYILSRSGFLSGILFTIGVFLLNFWLAIWLNLWGIQFDYSRVIICGMAFFITASLYKYLAFLSRLLKIKYRVTIDPLRNVFTLRYFYYRLELELRKIYFRRDFYLIFINLGAFTEELEDYPLESVRDLWRQLVSAVSLKGSFWSAYGQDELIGCVIGSPSRMETVAGSLHNRLVSILKERGISSDVKVIYLRFKKGYQLQEVLPVLSSELKKSKGEVILLKDNDLSELLRGSYLRKAKDGGQLLDSLGEDVEERNRQLLVLIENLRKEHAKTKQAFFEIIASLVNALEARDPYTQGHSQRVANYALRLSERLGWNSEEKEKLHKAALLHDLGKIGIPDSILHKRGGLNEEEYDFIKKHELIAVKILEPLNELKEILPWIMYHHERWDGKGYPYGLAADAIPEASQIISIADVYDALTTGRDYKEAFSTEDSINELVKNKGTFFNPRLVDIFTDMMRNDQLKNDLHPK